MGILESIETFLHNTIDLDNAATLAFITVTFLVINRVIPLKFGIPFITTLLCGAWALYIIVANDFMTESTYWAYASAGALFGFWMRRVSL